MNEIRYNNSLESTKGYSFGANEDGQKNESSMASSIESPYTMASKASYIFIEIESKYFIETDTPQKKQVSIFLNCLWRKVDEFIRVYGDGNHFPKLKMEMDGSTIILYWEHKTFRIYFNFERDASESTYGIVRITDPSKVFMQSDELKESNFLTIIDSVLKAIASEVLL